MVEQPNPGEIIAGNCPACGPTSIAILMTGSSHLNMLEGPNLWLTVWMGRYEGCQTTIETEFDEVRDPDPARFLWEVVDEQVVDFILGGWPSS